MLHNGCSSLYTRLNLIHRSSYPRSFLFLRKRESLFKPLDSQREQNLDFVRRLQPGFEHIRQELSGIVGQTPY